MKTRMALVALSAVFSAAFAAEPEAAQDRLALDAEAGNIEMSVTKKGAQGAPLVNIVCEDVQLSKILQQFRKNVDANIVSCESTNLSRRVSISLHDTPWLESLKSVLDLGGFRLDERDGIYFVNEMRANDPIARTKSFVLNHADARGLAELFNEAYGVKSKDGKLVKGVATCFRESNVVVVNATDKVIGECEGIIRAVDKAIAQIYIEARFLELSTESLHKLGLQWNQLASWGVTAHDLKGGVEFNNGKAAHYANGKTESVITSGESSLVRTTQNYLRPDGIGEAPGAGLGADSMSWRNANGFSGQLSADDFRLALSAFEQLEDGRIFSNPKVIVSNGKMATVDMTTKFPNVRLTSQRNTQNDNAYLDMSAELTEIPGDKGHKEFDYKDKALFAGSCFYEWGITLTVRPCISPDGLISVEIVPSISQLDYETSQTGFYEVKSDNTVGLFPVIGMKRIITDFTMKDGATAVIGGLSRTVEEDVDNGIPYLRKIPWIGPKLFGWKSRQKVQKEIVVCVTIGIANPSELPRDIGLPKNAVISREFVEGRQQEPGDHSSFSEAVKLDMRDVEERRTGPAEDEKAGDEPTEAPKAAETPKAAEAPKTAETPKADSAVAQVSSDQLLRRELDILSEMTPED